MEKSLIQGDNQQERVNDKHWLIGIIEGEGCFTLNAKQRNGSPKKAYFPMIQISNTNIAMIEEAKRILSDNGLTCYFFSYLKQGQKPYFRIEVAGMKRVKRFMDVFGEMFRSRQEQANKLKEYVKLRLSKISHSPITDEEHRIAKELKALNSPLSSQTIRLQRQKAAMI